jgi:hypothetical protein
VILVRFGGREGAEIRLSGTGQGCVVQRKRMRLWFGELPRVVITWLERRGLRVDDGPVGQGIEAPIRFGHVGGKVVRR